MTKIKIVSWNVNSVNARLDSVLFYLNETKPDVVLLQEIKCENEKFPLAEIEDLGYNCEVFGQKSYNGVAILSKFPIADVVRNFNIDDVQSRYIEAVIELPNQAIRVASIYVPNGGAVLEEGQKLNESERFIYKMNFFDGLKARMQKLLRFNEIAVFGGDYNVALENIDVFDSKGLKNKLCFHDDEKRKMRALLNLGLDDSFRMKKPELQNFSWWDYRGNCWGYNKGMRIDYLLTSPKATDLIESAFMDDELMMNRQKPSDHCPVAVELKLN
ncbi:MAG: exodeoxyribonuclease-3 [Lentimonas sp.]|jgi:exodeoxyribonuclease-3